jgi:hypothetical protein
MSHNWQLAIDCADPASLSAFWAEALGYVLQPPPEGHASWTEYLESIGVPASEHNSASAVVDPEGIRPRIYFQRVPEGKIVKNRLHIDVPASQGPEQLLDERIPLQDAARDRLVAAGASEVGPVHEYGSRWIVMQDPEGNEFCIT